jgi:hypothetical protein
MAKAYWVVCYKSIKNPEKLAAYAKIVERDLRIVEGVT